MIRGSSRRGARCRGGVLLLQGLVIDDALKVASQGIDRGAADLVVSLLALDWRAGADGTGRITLVLAGDGAVAVDVEALEVTLKDVTQPYRAPSGQTPRHPD